MGAFSIWHWLIVLVVVMVLFGGKGKISSLMGDVAKGIKSFKKGMAEDIDDVADDADGVVKTIDNETEKAAKAAKSKAKEKA